MSRCFAVIFAGSVLFLSNGAGSVERNSSISNTLLLQRSTVAIQILYSGSGIAQPAVCWARCPAWCSVVGSSLLSASGWGEFSFRVNMGSDAIPQNSFGWEHYRGLVCSHIHPSQGLKKSWHSCPRRANAGNKNTPRTYHPQRRNVTASMVGLKKMVTNVKISRRMVTPRDIAGKAEEDPLSGGCHKAGRYSLVLRSVPSGQV